MVESAVLATTIIALSDVLSGILRLFRASSAWSAYANDNVISNK
jgi:hypothetical protein